MLRTIKTLFGVVAVILAGPALALEYSLQPSAQANATHTDNIRLTAEDPISLQGREVSTAVESQVASESWQLETIIDLRFNNFNREEFDSDDQDVDLNFNKDTERSSFGLRSNVTRDSTRTSEIDTTGNIGVEAERRESVTINPYWSYLVNDINRVSLEGSASQVDYAGARFTDYDYDVLTANWFTVYSDALTFQVNLSATNYESEKSLSTFQVEYFTKTEGLALQVGGDYKITEQLSVNALVGTRESDQVYEIEDPLSACTNPVLRVTGRTPQVCDLEDYNDRSITADISVLHEGERSNFSMSYSISNEPTSRGYEVESEELRVKWHFRASERDTLDAKMLYGQVQAIDVSVSAIDPENANRDFLNANILYGHQLTESWRVEADFGYRWQDKEAAQGSAESYAVKLGVRYRPTRFIWSR